MSNLNIVIASLAVLLAKGFASENSISRNADSTYQKSEDENYSPIDDALLRESLTHYRS